MISLKCKVSFYLYLQVKGIIILVEMSSIAALLKEEEKKFVESHPASKALYEKGKSCLLGGVPMNWMVRWGPFPIFVEEAKGSAVIDVDNKKYIDFCYGDTGMKYQ